MYSNRVSVFDTTLRDGAQTPGLGMTLRDRLYIAKALANTGVDVIEIGFAANNIDFPYMREIAKYVGSREYSKNRTVPVVCSLARALPGDVRLAYESIEHADPDKRRIHVFIGTSEELMSYSHGKKEKVILKMIDETVPYARHLVGDMGQVEYSSEDALRTDINFLAETVQAAVSGGACVINVPDTTGFARPDVFYNTISLLRKMVKGIDNVTLSAHVHNDSSNAVAATLKGIEAGVRQIEGCVLQLGERAGNGDWMAVVNDLRVLKDYYGIDASHIDSTQFYGLAKLVSSITGYPLPLTHPVVGKAAFSESSGIHVNGVIQNYTTYFIIPPETVGREIDIVLGQTSGTNTTAYFLRKHGYGDADKDYSLNQVAEMTEAAKRYSVMVGDSLTETEAKLLAEHYINGMSLEKRLVMKDYKTATSMKEKPRTEVTLELDGIETKGKGRGEGPVDSYMNAVKSALGMDVELHFWDEKAVYRGKGAPGYELVDMMEFGDEELALCDNNGSKGQEADARSMIELLYNGEIFHGRGFARDITRSTYDAITDALDAIYRLKNLKVP